MLQLSTLHITFTHCCNWRMMHIYTIHLLQSLDSLMFDHTPISMPQTAIFPYRTLGFLSTSRVRKQHESTRLYTFFTYRGTKWTLHHLDINEPNRLMDEVMVKQLYESYVLISEKVKNSRFVYMNRRIASELHITSSYARMTFVQRWWQKANLNYALLYAILPHVPRCK